MRNSIYVWEEKNNLAVNTEKDYIMSSIDEYFEILDKETQTRSKMVAKSLTKYLKNTKENELKTTAIH